jgi:hypothetical protein
METSRASSLKLTVLLEESLTANDSLRSYNAQIAERMQRRDEDLAAAYEDINRLEQQRLKLILAVVVLAAVIITVAAVKMAAAAGKLYRGGI